MTDRTNPVSLLADILIKANHHLNVGGINLLQALCFVMKQRTGEVPATCDNPQNYMDSVSELLALAENAKKFIHINVRERSRANITAKVDIATNYALTKGISMHKETPNEKTQLRLYSEAVMEVGDSLAPFDNQKIASKEDIAEIIAKIDDVMEFVMNSSLDDQVKTRLLRALGMLRSSVQRSRFTSVDEIIADMDSVLGAGVRALGTAQTPEQHEDAQTFLQKAAETSESLGKVIEFGSKYLAPLAPTVIKALTGS